MFCYFLVPWRANPRFVIRFAGVDQTNPHIFGDSGSLNFGVSTKRTDPVTITSVTVEPLLADPVHFKGNDPLKAALGNSRGISLRWNGEEQVTNGNFICFAVPFEIKASGGRPTSTLVSISVSGRLAAEHWGFPWSLFSEPTKTENYIKHFSWKLKPEPGEETGFKLGPLESMRIFGDAAKQGFVAHGPPGVQAKLKTIELMEDGSYETNWLPPATSSSPSPR
jgi:hypothetical protein